MEYYSAMKRNEIGSFAEKWKNLESVIPEWSKSEKEKQITYMNPNTWNQEKQGWWIYLQGRNRNGDIENIVKQLSSN